MKKGMSKIQAVVAGITLAIVLQTGTAQAAEMNRLHGQDRYETAVSITKANWNSSDNVVLSTGEGDDKFADALAGTALAYSLDSPMLLTNTASLPKATLNEVVNLKPRNIYLLGGTGVVSSNIEQSLKTKGYNVIRLYGQDRYETAVKIAEEVRKHTQISKVFLTTGQSFQYAMASAPYVGKEKAVTLFTDGSTLKAVTKNEISKLKNNGVSVTILGGDKIVSSNIEKELDSMGVPHTRIKGNTPQEFNSNIVSSLGNNINGIAVANDTVFADSLSGSVVAAKNNLAITLVGKGFNYNIDKNKVSKILIFGGPGAVSTQIENSLKSLFPDNQSQDSGINTSYPITAKGTDPLPIKDASFKAQLDKNYSGAVKTVEDAKGVTDLWLTGVSDIQGIQYFQNLERLTISKSNFKDLSFLSQMPNLKSVEIDAVNIESLKGIENNTTLEELGVFDCPNLKDITAIANLKNLKYLSLSSIGNSTPIDLSNIRGLNNLECLFLQYTTVKNESVIKNFTKLGILNMEATNIKDGTIVANLNNLKDLNVGKNPGLTSIANLKNATGLQFLNLGMTPINDLSVVKDNYKLKAISITEDAFRLNPEIINSLIQRGVEVIH